MVIYRGDLPHLKRPQGAHTERSLPPASRGVDSAEDCSNPVPAPLTRRLRDKAPENGTTPTRRPTGMDL